MKLFTIQMSYSGVKWYDCACGTFETLQEARKFLKETLDSKDKAHYRILETKTHPYK